METNQRRPTIKDLWKALLAVVGVIAVIQELRKPREERTWHGTVANLVPYDFRLPTWDRIKTTYWNPGGPLLPGKVFGVGWAFNFGAVGRMLGKSETATETPPQV
ncbi:MAG TPA: hypothetical protein VJ858_04170 [Acidimicrobiia bacterium]|nr:hypothetical protein [Acidimicrobiia bacterium]